LSTIVQASTGVFFSGGELCTFTLYNQRGTQIVVSNLGATIVSLITADGRGQFGDIVLGYADLSTYLQDDNCFGCVVGRYANRIAKGQFRLGEQVYSLACNNGPNHLHGGKEGFNRKLWRGEIIECEQGSILELSYVSPAGEEGYPGRLSITLTYSLSDDNKFTLSYRAFSDAETVINLSNHMYFNLAGSNEGGILDHQVFLNSDTYLPVDADMIPRGELERAQGAFDFRQPRHLGEALADNHPQIVIAKGFDHNWVLKKTTSSEQRLAASVFEPSSGRVMDVFTDQPGVQFYTGNHISPKHLGKQGRPYSPYDGFCLETQNFPDSPNQAHFPSCILKPGELYETSTSYRFGIKY